MLILGVVVGFGELVVKDGPNNWLGDTAIPRSFAAHRTPAGDHWSDVISVCCAAAGLFVVAVAACLLFLLFIRRWRPVIFLAVVMFGELAAFLAAAAVVKRPRPYVHRLDRRLPAFGLPVRARRRLLLPVPAIAVVASDRPVAGAWLCLVPAMRRRCSSAIPDVPRRAPPHRRHGQSHLRRALAHRDHAADQAERGAAQPYATAWPHRPANAYRPDGFTPASPGSRWQITREGAAP